MRPLRKVLVADDSRMGLMLLEELFEPYPVEVIRTVNGEEALRLVLEHGPDLVVSDILMPRVDGIALTRKIRARGDGPQPVVILVTALTVRGELRTEATLTTRRLLAIVPGFAAVALVTRTCRALRRRSVWGRAPCRAAPKALPWPDSMRTS